VTGGVLACNCTGAKSIMSGFVGAGGALAGSTLIESKIFAAYDGYNACVEGKLAKISFGWDFTVF